jgi:ribosomal protein RSM22 (predicted rRNA methylase)
MAAPCPSASPCPLPDSDWCHFGARVERSGIHRRLKDGGLNYEDEKFSYVALAREPVTLPESRIVRRPEHRPGLISIQICTPAGIRAQRITKRDRDLFRAARRASWGDAL